MGPEGDGDVAERLRRGGGRGGGRRRWVRGGVLLTWLPAEGETVDRGKPLYKVDNEPVVLLFGTVPVYERLAPGVTGLEVVTVTVADRQALGALDAAPVDVVLRADSAENVLTVPVNALVALAEGGYGVQVVDGAGTRYVAVTTGMFADGRVEVSGPELAEGMTVGVPK